MNDLLPQISIIIPVYNVEEYIVECLQSVMRQTYKGEMECILVDDCGTDNSIGGAETMVANYKGEIDFRILHHEHNRGLSAARNTGTEAANGEYVFYIDSDDFIEPDTIEKLYNAFSLYPNVAFTSVLPYTYPQRGARVFVENWKHPDGKVKVIEAKDFNLTFLKLEVCFTAWGKLFKREYLKNVRFMEGRNNEDTRFFYDLAPTIEKHNLCVVELPDQLYAYRVNDSGICSDDEKLTLAHLNNLIDIKNDTRDSLIYQFVTKKAFLLESSYIQKHANETFERCIEDDFFKYTIAEIWSLFHSIKKCVKFVVLKNSNMRRMYHKIVKGK